MTRKNMSKTAMRGMILLLVCAAAGLGVASTPPATLKAISVSVPPGANSLQLRIDGAYSFNAVQATPDTLFIDLAPATADNLAATGEWTGGLLTGYRLVQFTNPAKVPVVRLQVEMKHHQEFQVERTNDSLSFVFGDSADVPAPSVISTPTPAVVPGPSAVARPSEPKAEPVAKSTGEFALVSGVSINPGPSGELFVDVDMSQPTTYHVIQLSNPRRLVVDLDKAHQALRQKTFPGKSPLLSDVRVGQFRDKDPAVVRVVADLAADAVFDVHAQPGGIRIELKPHVTVSQAAKPPSHSLVASAQPAGNQVIVLPFASQVRTSALLTAETINPPEMAKTEVVAPPAIEEKAELVLPSHPEFQNTLPPPPVSNEVSAAPRLDPTDKAPEDVKADHAAKVMAGSTEVNLEQTPAQNPDMTPEQPHYTGEPISLNLKDVDLKDFFRLIHEISGLNILVDPNVTGTVTMVLDNVPWDQALDIVLKNNQLGKTLEGNVLRISKLETLAAQQEAAAKLVQARDDAQPLVTKFVPVNYASAKALQTMLKTWTGGGALSKRGNILVDDRTNTLIISDIASQIPIIEQIIQRLDTKTKQVSIEARVLLTTQLFERDLSGALNNGIVNPSTSTVTGGATGSNASVTGNIPGVGSTTRITIGQTSAAGFGAYAISNMGARYFINAMIAASEQKAESKTISKPMIVTQNNVAGTVEQGVEIPVQTNINNTISITYVNAALTLTVTPQITQDGNVFLVIKVDNASPGDIVPGVGTSINHQAANTQVLVPDGGTVIFGGITVSGSSKAATYVPWVGQIPLLGQLFKTSTKKSNENELLFFVTPKVLPG
ncbi:MAG TPA: type IV pilus secretin PilQ [Terriglobia bacterium]|nr:type IV pilus secretin PilQ [Terriglobia bacterium]